MSGPGMLLGTMSESWPGCVLMSMAHVATKRLLDVSSLGLLPETILMAGG